MRGISALLLIMALIVLPLIALLYYIGVAVCVAAIVCAMVVIVCFCLSIFHLENSPDEGFYKGKYSGL